MSYIFVHGLGQDSSSWKDTISHLNINSDIYRPDLFEMVEGRELTYQNVYLAFSKYLEQFSEPVTLVGLSLGAILAMNYTIENPDKVNTQVLIAPQYKMPKLLLKIQNGVFRILPESIFQKMGSSKKDILTLTKSMVELDFSKEVRDIRRTTLILVGENDRNNRKAAETLTTKIPNADFQTVTNAGHEVNIDNPEELARILEGLV